MVFIIASNEYLVSNILVSFYVTSHKVPTTRINDALISLCNGIQATNHAIDRRCISTRILYSFWDLKLKYATVLRLQLLGWLCGNTNKYQLRYASVKHMHMFALFIGGNEKGTMAKTLETSEDETLLYNAHIL